MKNRIKYLLVFFAFCCNSPVVAQDDLSRLIKAQDDIDKSIRQKNKVAKKDVFSNSDDNRVSALALPLETHCVEIKEVVIEDNFMKGAFFEKIKTNVAGRCLGSVGIETLARDLQDYMIKSGYVTSRVELPDQDLSSKKLVLRVIPGRIERVVIKEHNIIEWILPFKANDILNIRDIEQGLEVLQRAPDLNVKVNIEPGNKNSYSNVIINTSGKKNWNAKTWLNNWGDKSTGKILAGGAVYSYNQAKMNDIFYVSGTTNTERVNGGYKNFSTYYSVPNGYWDYELFYSNSESKQKIGDEVLDLKYIGKSQYISLKGSRIVYRDQDKKVAASAELSKRKVNYTLNDIQLELQKREMTNVKFGLNYKQNFNGSALDTTASYQRFLPWLGAEETPDMKSGDVSSKNHIFNLDLNYIKLLNIKPINAYYDAKLGSQYSPGALTLQDQLSIGNRWSVRGFENSAELNGDKGFHIQNNFNIITGISNIEWYLGVDYGQIWGDVYPVGVYNKKNLLGTATGLKGNINSLGYDFSLSAPLTYPKELALDKLNINFSIYHQL
ncbi:MULTISPECIES: ShlB/FhaC/HecB family hemolysin secretion/activation protein [unclassified Serratia (in: enterobacteria)]|uniref:ShlB/FhaC/HecB family hemolysin secretion/activation protein n=1 Tax=unclassified Serratia (in: enterobacteria) TaxID=2647522 RepID=UPI000506568F|nr:MULTISPECIES: ShlB/FhaC/HecB family hemolysin secretion/activation protein [unclassified Serratia (in: enterobacteria)]KFK94345.1 peptide ABC transporter permease [Serratia sp. Ag2]KFK99530.1 peptide ABC transporter permease [Serratia sp. Ag1]